MPESDGVLVLFGPPGYGEPVEGEVLVTRSGFSPRYDLDRSSGVISRTDHDLDSIAGRILVCAAAKGGVAAGWAMYDLQQRGLAPLAMVFEQVNPVFVQGCVMAGIPIIAGLSPAPTTTLSSGARVELDPRVSRLVIRAPAVEEADPAGEARHAQTT